MSRAENILINTFQVNLNSLGAPQIFYGNAYPSSRLQPRGTFWVVYPFVTHMSAEVNGVNHEGGALKKAENCSFIRTNRG